MYEATGAECHREGSLTHKHREMDGLLSNPHISRPAGPRGARPLSRNWDIVMGSCFAASRTAAKLGEIVYEDINRCNRADPRARRKWHGCAVQRIRRRYELRRKSRNEKR